MKRLIAFILFLTGLNLSAEARHIAGGEMSYTYLGVGSNPTSGRYRITLRLYRDCQSTGAPLDTRAAITIYQTGVSEILRNIESPLDRTDVLQLTSPGPCIDNAPIICYQVGIYEEDVELPFNPAGYTIPGTG